MMSKTIKNQSLLTVLGLSEDSANCGNCQHFVQLYAKEQGYPTQFIPCYVGTCTCPRMKSRKVYDTCIHFERRQEEE